ncbi:MAG: histidine kinase dimerization/phosphoacceptor domain -containing protein [Bacteroidota bacterium]
MSTKSFTIWIISWYLFLPFVSHSQSERIDSLQALLDSQPKPERAGTYLQLANELLSINIRKVPPLLDSAFYYSSKSNNQTDLGIYYQTMGIERWYNGYYQRSRDFLHMSAQKHIDLGDSVNLTKDWQYLGMNYLYDAHYDSALIFLNRSLAISTSLDLKGKMIENYDHIAVVYRQLGDYQKVLKYSTKGLEVRNSTKGYSNTTKYYTHGGKIFNQKAFEEAVKYHKKVLNEVDPNDKEKVGLSINNIGSTFMNAGIYDSAIYYYRQSSKLIGESRGGNSYAGQLNELGEALFANKQYEEAEKVFLEAKHIWDSIGHRISLSIINHNLARTYLGLGKIEAGFEMTTEVKKLIESMSRNAFFSQICLLKARYLMELDDPNGAMQEATIALENAKKLSLKAITVDCYEVMKHICLIKKDYQKALEFTEKYIEMKDSLYNDRASLQLAEMQVTYETEKKNQTIESLNAQFELKETQLNQQNFIITLTLIILLISILFILNRYRYIKKLSIQNAQIATQKNSLVVANSEKEFMLYEIHHRVKNNLQMIISMLNIQSNKSSDKKVKDELSKNKDRLQAMAMIHQQLYEGHNLKENVNIKEYLYSLVNQLLGATNSKIDIQFTEHIDPIHVDYDTAISIGLIVNELVSNAIKHAFKNTKSPHLDISLRKSKDYYVLKVKDNGNGASQAALNKDGFGLKLITSFLYELDGEVKINSDDGTTACVTFRDPSPNFGNQ